MCSTFISNQKEMHGAGIALLVVAWVSVHVVTINCNLQTILFHTAGAWGGYKRTFFAAHV